MITATTRARATIAETLKPVFQQHMRPERLELYPLGKKVGQGKKQHERKRRPYRRVWTPLVTVWGMVWQRLGQGATSEAVVSAFRSGSADDIEVGAEDRHRQPLSQRMKSESNAGYIQARERVPVEMIRLGRADIQASVAVAQAGGAHWRGHAVRLVDGTTYRMPACGDMPATYGQASNQYGPSAWVIAKSVAAFCLFSRTLVGHAEGAWTVSEASLLMKVMQEDGDRESVYVGDIGYGHYQVVQVAHATGHPVVVRLDARVARKMLRELGQPERPASGWECPWTWQPDANTVTEPGLPAPGIAGRLAYVRVMAPTGGWVDIYLFTTLTDAVAYPIAEVAALYLRRWEAELRYRDLKTTLGMEEFDVRSASAFQRELEVGLLAFNLISSLMTLAALAAGVSLAQLSFTSCLRRIRDTMQYGIPAWVSREYARPLDWLLERLAQCRLPSRHHKAPVEPRVVRRRPEVFPAFKGSRQDARRKLLAQVRDAVAEAVNS